MPCGFLAVAVERCAGQLSARNREAACSIQARALREGPVRFHPVVLLGVYPVDLLYM